MRFWTITVAVPDDETKDKVLRYLRRIGVTDVGSEENDTDDLEAPSTYKY
jgi:hypothetical protein